MARSSVEHLGERHQVVGRRDDVGPDDDVVWRACVVGLDAPPQQAARDDRNTRRRWHPEVAPADDGDGGRRRERSMTAVRWGERQPAGVDEGGGEDGGDGGR